MSLDDLKPSLVERAAKRMAEKQTTDKDSKSLVMRHEEAKSTQVNNKAHAANVGDTIATSKLPDEKISKPHFMKEEQGAKTGAKQDRFKIDMASLRKKGMITPNTIWTSLLKDMRSIKRTLLRQVFRDKAKGGDENCLSNVIMVSSCRPGEGKTFTSLNLALSIAMERDLYVLLIDTDMYRHGISELLDIPLGPGLVEVLLNEDQDVSEMIIPTTIEKLSVIQAGNSHSDMTELLASERMGRIIRDMSMRYPDRMIIIDAPPVLASGEPKVLAGCVGHVLLVIQEGKTNRQALNSALDELVDAKQISFILNKHRQRPWDDHSSENYNYGVGS